MNLTILLNLIKSEAEKRDLLYKRFLEENHPDAQKIFNFHNKIVNDAIDEYLKNGGKKDVLKFKK